MINSKNLGLSEQPSTGFPIPTDPAIPRKMLLSIFVGAIVATGANIQSQYYYHQDKNNTASIIVQQAIEKDFSDSYLTSPMIEAHTVDEQLMRIKQSMGFNILEMAEILKVARPTIYSWFDKSKPIEIHKKNQSRLNSIYEVCKLWESKHIGSIGSLLNKPIGAENISLLRLLKEPNLDLDKIHRHLNSIASIISKKRQDNAVRETLLRKHGFEPLSEEEMQSRLNDIDFLD